MKKIALIVLALVLALGAAGIGFAKWSETLHIEGTVSTGEVDVGLSQYSNDPSPTGDKLGDYYEGSRDPMECGHWEYCAEGPCWVGERYDKNVASIDCELVDSDEASDGEETIEITVKNAYPCYYGSIAFDIDNVGTIPVKVESIILTEVSKGETVYEVNFPLEEGTTYYVDADSGAVDMSLDEGDDFSLCLQGMSVGTQVDPDTPKYGAICVHVEQDAEEGAKYDFEITIVCSQWNEVAPPSPSP